ncbi:SusD/RagB family nutrient-binding outer membrane lipoprotein [Sphingobacterium yanglingense]|uniref:SusD-like starch-binding protein associating with outer membrane n=1 Tax=Sphingobacterium yanglingense TaxID=1437280 RepID=A0A4R6WI55_9SPHI|nr:SusD/RagB family nutrient-binding outer membrane lipoprotein [Sphingobacterium yanglingense]TDQ79940.1 SusD-like starch-binding protein associating with outer membrane [Sphingobacterium yanglingense]
MRKKISSPLLYTLLCVGLSVSSCGDYFKLDENPNLVTKPTINGLLTTATHKAGMNSYRAAYITTNYMQYTASVTPGSSSDNYEPTNPASAWDNLYYSLSDAYDLMKRSEEQQAPHHLGIGQALMAYQLGLVADFWGNAPYSEAFGKVKTLQPKYDTEEELYKAQVDLLDQAIANLKKPNTVLFSDGSDLIHANNSEKWLKTAYALKARVLNKVSKKTVYDGKAILAAIDNAYKANSDDAGMATFKGINPWAQVATNNDNLNLDGWLSANFIDHLNGKTYGQEDPRIGFITEKSVVGNIYIGTRNGQGNTGSNTIKDECYISKKSPLTAPTSPVTIVSYAEIKMVEAEAALRLGEKKRAYAAYKEGIKAHFEKIGVQAAELTDYLSRSYVDVGENNLKLSDIFREKYTITYLNPEGWNDLRRNDYQLKDFQMPVNAKLPTFIRRLAYPSSERAENGKNVPEQVSLDTKLWWDKP